jgi:hypothetical protein
VSRKGNFYPIKLMIKGHFDETAPQEPRHYPYAFPEVQDAGEKIRFRRF